MHIRKLSLATLSLAVLSIAVSAADVSRPDAPDAKASARHTRLVVTKSLNVTAPKLIVPRDLLAGAAVKSGESAGTIGPTQTILAGLSLSLAMASFGVWLVRSGRMGRRTVTTVGLVVLAAGSAVLAHANVAPPRPHPLTELGKVVPNYDYLAGDVEVEVDELASDLHLILPSTN
jgi:hypothetical protein